MFNLFKSKKDPGKASAKPSRKAQTASNRAGARTTPTETRSWFAKPSRPARREGQIKSISLSSPSLNNNNESKKTNNKRPLTIVGSSNVTLRRGQQTSKIEGQEDLSRSSSITNLNAEKGKGAKPKKAESKDKLDKLEKKHDKNRGSLTKNNNKEAEESADSLTDVEALQKQLAQMANDKTNLALQLGEQTGQLNSLHNEFLKLKMLQEESVQKLEQLGEENSILRNRLRDVAHSPLSDTEKQQLLYESHRHSSAPASIATNLLDDGGDITACPTPEWDKHSSSNVSEVSVACLQDKINQMQETHYSTNEELQATLQELTDLQRQLTELQQENLRLNDEKNLMFESLCRQTERLNDSRNEVESLKQLLYKDESGQFETAAEREQKLVDLLKSAQEEREALLMKQEQLGNDLEDSRSTNLIHNDEIAQLTERVKTLESTLDAKHAEHKLLDQELAQAKDQSSGRQIEINRLKDLLENARTKINELEQDRALSDKSELDELLDNARKEKDALESEVAHLKEQLALSKNETEKLKEQVSILQEECKVIRNNAKTTQSDLEYKLEKLLVEKNTLGDQLQQFQEAVNELQVQSQCQLDDKRQLSAVLSETQRNLNESERKIVSLESELSELKKTKQEQEEEWEKFQNDLLTSVRVANDFKTEAQQDLQKLIMENKAGRERIKQLEAQIDKLKGGRRKPPNKHLTTEENLMASLQRRYKEIENLSEEQLTEEQKAIKVLKTYYDGSPKQRPVARKSKDKLAISKPSLDSVISNPKLGKIVNDPKLQNVEAFEYFSDDEEARNRLSVMSKVHSDSALPDNKDHQEEIVRSKSLTDIHKEIDKEEPSLRRYESTEHLPSLSNQRSRHRSTVNLNILEEICKNIDPNTPEDQLTKEQRFALRLREVLLKEEKKTTLKRPSKLGRKKIVISKPTKESVVQNEKLLHIIEDPVIQSVPVMPTKVTKRTKPIKREKDRYSMPTSMQQKSSKPPNKSKSYNDISFSFNNAINMYSEPEEGKNLNQIPEVLPPEEFRDPSPPLVRQDGVLTTFQADTNTLKKEHNYLDDDLDLEYIDEDADGQKTIDEGDQEVASVDTADFKDDHDFSDVLNDILLRRLDQEDNRLYHLDEEEIRARHDSRKRFSRVVGEIKEKFESTDEEEEKEAREDVVEDYFTEVPLPIIENVDWVGVEIVEDAPQKVCSVETTEENLKPNEDHLKKTVEAIAKTQSIEDNEVVLDLKEPSNEHHLKKILENHVAKTQRIEDKEAREDAVEDSFTEVLLPIIENVDWVAVEIVEDAPQKMSSVETTEENLKPDEDHLKKTIEAISKTQSIEDNEAVLDLKENSNEHHLKKILEDHVAKTQRIEDGDTVIDFEEATVLSPNEDELKKVDDVAEKETILKKEMDLLTSEDNVVSIEDAKIQEISNISFKFEDRTKESYNFASISEVKSGNFKVVEEKEEILEDFEQDWSDEESGFLKKHIKSEDVGEESIHLEKEVEFMARLSNGRSSDIKVEDLLMLDVANTNEDLKREEISDGRSSEEMLTTKDIDLLPKSPKPLADIDKEDLHKIKEQGKDLKQKLDVTSDDSTEESVEDSREILTQEEMDLLKKIPKGRASRPLSDINPEDLLLIDRLRDEYFRQDEEQETEEQKLKVEDEQNVTEVLSKEEMEFLEKVPEGQSSRPLFDINSVDELREDGVIDEEDEDQKIQLLTKEEMKFLEKIPEGRASRPLSDINPEDLLLVSRLTEEYLHDDEETTHEKGVPEMTDHKVEEQELNTEDSQYVAELLTKEEIDILQKNPEDHPSENLLLMHNPKEEVADGDQESKTDRSKDLLTEEEMQFLQRIPNDEEQEKHFTEDEEIEVASPLPDIKSEDLVKTYNLEPSDIADDLMVLEKFRKQYLSESEEKKEEERHRFPRILSPTKLTEPTSYEPVYANFQVTSGRSDNVPPPIFGKKPMALPRVNTFNTATTDEHIYRDFGGQVRKTRFSITYDMKKSDLFKETNQEKKTRVKDLRDVFERKSQSNFPSSVSKAPREGDC